MSIFKLNPNFDRIRGALAFPTKELNYLLRQEVYDTFSFYQSQYGIYSFMKITKDLKYKIHSMDALPMVFQKYRSCHVDPLGNIELNVREITPCKGVALTEFCNDELLESCFSHFFNWDGMGPLELDENGAEMFRMLTEKILETFVIGARLTLTASGVYDINSVTFKESVTEEVKNMFRKTADTCQGWLAYVKMLGKDAAYPHLNVQGLLNANNFNGRNYTGSIEAVLDGLIENSTDDLGSIIDQGGISGLSANGSGVIFKLSTFLFKAMVKEYRHRCEDVLCLNKRLSMEEADWMGRKVKVYFFDGIPIVPIDDMNEYDKHLKNNTHFAILTVAGNVNLGASFNDIPMIGNNNGVGMRIYMDDSNSDYGKFSWRTDSLFSASIANTDYMTAACIQTIEA